MTYEIYRKKINMDQYFKAWSDENMKGLTKSLKKQIYDKYLFKCKVFNRDNFKCQNIQCQWPESPLTLHHVKFQKNGGMNKERNGVTLCNACHQGFHKAKRAIIFPDEDYLPVHIKGHTFKLSKPDKVNWKKIRAEMKQIRKNLKDQGITFKIKDWEHIELLMRWLYIPFDECDD